MSSSWLMWSFCCGGVEVFGVEVVSGVLISLSWLCLKNPSVLSILWKSVCASLTTRMARIQITLQADISPIPRDGAMVLARVYSIEYAANPKIHPKTGNLALRNHGRFW